MQPIIGITGNYSEAEANFWLRQFYVESVTRVGGTPIILPPVLDSNLIDKYIHFCQAFIFSGGGDIDPFYWGALPEWCMGEVNPLRDHFELTLARKLLSRDKPVLAICRGCQIINVAAGGSLWQDIQTDLCHDQKAPRNYPFHDIFVREGTLLNKILKKSAIRVNSFHHQAVDKLGSELVISAWAPDGIIEAVEKKGHPFYLGVQWHPECMDDDNSSNLFRALIEAACI
ncbi:MAG: gamma-glutamyl-gamma-aminobutyrate hydrolase family protein [Syntrophomonadaceae bacterium]